MVISEGMNVDVSNCFHTFHINHLSETSLNNELSTEVNIHRGICTEICYCGTYLHSFDVYDN